MNLVTLAGLVAGLLAATGAAVSLWRAALRHTGPVRHAYRWFAVAAVLSYADLVVSLTVQPGGAAMLLSFADLPALALLPVMATALGGLASAGRAGLPLPSRYPRRGQTSAWAHVADGFVLASALFLLGWITMFAPILTRSGEGGATFAGELIHPVADLVFLGGTLAAAGAAGRRGIAPYLALAAMTVSDFLAVGARVGGTRPGVAALIVQLAVFGLLALTSRDYRVWPDEGTQFKGVTTAVAGAAAGAAGLIVAVYATSTGHSPKPVVLSILGVTAMVLAARVVSLVWRVNSWSQVWQESGRQFRQLADRTSDVVLLCGLDGVIRYASRAVAGYGYTPETLRGTLLADLLHPEDRDGGMLAVHRAVLSPVERVAKYSCRVRAVDGTWRHVESTISRYRELRGPDQLLVTAKDVSAQVALRQQIAHLKFHDALTGLPNRANVEQRATEVFEAIAQEQVPAGHADAGLRVAGVMVVDVDGFTTTNEAVGHGAGDLLLAQVARRLRLAVSPQDMVARWGGDEFAILIEDASSADELADVGQRLARGICSVPFHVGETDVDLTASVGVALADGSPAGHVWRNAEVAAASAKQAGGGRVEVFGAQRPRLVPQDAATGERLQGAATGERLQDAATGERLQDAPAGERPLVTPAEDEPPRSSLVS
jgi:diguanylate cyclase (GGDEF)-like protein/PAS domain S-box-containing protein